MNRVRLSRRCTRRSVTHKVEAIAFGLLMLLLVVGAATPVAMAANQVWAYIPYYGQVYRYDFNGNSQGSFGLGSSGSNFTSAMASTSSQVWAYVPYYGQVYRYNFNANSQGSFGLGSSGSNFTAAMAATSNQVWTYIPYYGQVYRNDFNGNSQGSFGLGSSGSNFTVAMASTSNQVWTYIPYYGQVYRNDFNGNSQGSFGLGSSGSNFTAAMAATSNQVWTYIPYYGQVYRNDFNGNSQGSFGLGSSGSNFTAAMASTSNQVWTYIPYYGQVYRNDFNGNSQGSFGLGSSGSNFEASMASIIERDCNSNGIPDGDDITGGTAADCNNNFVPDSCDIAGGTSADCNTDGIPDSCQTDCNTNGIPDNCDLLAGTSLDCNTNHIPDECDIRIGTSADCNTNGRPDECDIAGNTSADCNSNGIADECEPASGNITWTGPNGGSFTTNGNWNPASAPGTAGRAILANASASDNRCILNAGGTTVVCSVAVSASGAGRQILEIDNGSILRTNDTTTVSPGGDINLQDGELAGGPLTNTSNSVYGWGRISANVTNSGRIEGYPGENLRLTGNSLTNQSTGLIQAPIASLVHVQSSSVSQSGRLKAMDQSAILFDQPLTNAAGGLIELLGGGFSASSLTNQTGANISGFGTLTSPLTNGGSVLTLADMQIIGNLINNGTVTIQNGTFTVIGNVSGNGTIIGGFGGRDGDPRDNGFTVLGDYHVDPGGSLILDNATIRLGGDWDVAIDNPDRFDMTTSTLQLIGLPQNAPQDIEVMGEDIGGCGLVFPRRDLFSFRKFRIGPTATGARLVDNHINATGGIGREAMYVSQLVLEAGTSLDVAGLWLYYETVTPADPFAPNSGVRIIDSVGGGGIMSAATTAPEITVSPVSQSTCAGGSMTLTVTANGAPPLNYQWRKNGVLISGASDTTYTINPATAEDFGVYDVIVFNNCGLSISDSAVVEVWAAEPGDINGDTAINGLDIASFVTALQVHPNGPASLEFCSADMDHSGVIDGADVPLLVAALLGP